MPKMQASMTHANRATPYPILNELPSSSLAERQPYIQEFTTPPSNNERASTAWTTEDDQKLMRLRQQGSNWQSISNHFQNKTPNACRKRHERLQEKQNAESYDDGVRIEDLARAYSEVRERMWRILAEAVGEPKWQTVEIKCMEKGLKTLQTAGRAARRHEQGNNKPTPPRSHRSSSEVTDAAAMTLPMNQSPEYLSSGASSMMSGAHLAANYYPSALSSQRDPSVSSNSSMGNAGMQSAAMSMDQSGPMYSYAPSQQQQMYSTQSAGSPPYINTGFNMPLQNNFSAYTQPSNLPSLGRNLYESVPVTRTSPHSHPALLPPTSIKNLLATSGAHRESISPDY